MEPKHYLRSTSEKPTEADIMVWVAPHQYVNLAAAKKLGFVPESHTVRI